MMNLSFPLLAIQENFSLCESSFSSFQIACLEFTWWGISVGMAGRKTRNRFPVVPNMKQIWWSLNTGGPVEVLRSKALRILLFNAVHQAR
jgi:hypothetical protein